MTIKDWDELQVDNVVACNVLGEGEIRYRLTMRDNWERWIAIRLDRANVPIKTTVLLSKPEIFDKRAS